jgi:PPM family protein phosphatase
LNRPGEVPGMRKGRCKVADPSLEGTGTTLTAMLVSGSQLALVHIGDTRAYMLRDAELFQITHDHTVVQSLLDEGRITPDEAASHPPALAAAARARRER